jgi:hypothetical protein
MVVGTRSLEESLMSRLSIALATTCMSIAAGAHAETSVTMSVGSQPVAIHEISGIDVVENTFTADLPLASLLKLRVRGVYEGNLCGSDTVAFEKRGSVAESDSYDVYLTSVAFANLIVESAPCPAVSRPETFSGILEFAPTRWDDGQTVRKWHIWIRDGQVTHTDFEVKLDLALGWSVIM